MDFQVSRKLHTTYTIVIDDIVPDSVLWPALHYQDTMIRFKDCDWEAYKKVNRHFAVEIAINAADGEIVWVHDYHLMLLPQMLRCEAERWGKKLVIGFFLHTPFPSSDMFRVLPVWKELLEGLLHCDLIGFHSPSYNVNFKRTCGDLLYVANTLIMSRDHHIIC
jgi:trehalose 6-phosphate synthase